MNIRDRIIEEVQLLASPAAQLAYEKSLTVAGHAPTELVCGFCDDLYQPKSRQFNDAFSSDELRDLAHLYGLIVEASHGNHPSVSVMLKDSRWRRVVTAAKDVSSRLGSAT